jgi:alkanesulfonate monooxygenase SsuD/methylene tetrahydromethanopterin reductase-like flavin-dependent oxidoreductase (luciferase family)
MRIGISLPTMVPGVDRSLLRRWCVDAEAAGLDTLGFGERIAYHNLDLHTTLTFAAAVTQRIRIASTVVVAPMHPTVQIAKQSATLDVLSDGRYTLGVGVGGRAEDYRALGASFSRRFDRLDAQVGEIRRLWAGGAPADGLEPVGPAPIQRPIPILSGSLGPKSTARAARWADGIAGFVLDPSPMALGSAADLAVRAWEAAGRDSRPELWTSVWIALGPDSSARLRAYAMAYLGVFGEELASALADSCTCAGEDAAMAALDAAQAAGYDEIQLVPTSKDPGELDRILDLVHRWRS